LVQEDARPEYYEDIESERIPLKEALEMAARGEICDGKTTVALFRAASNSLMSAVSCPL
jgi:hypothetical protein